MEIQKHKLSSFHYLKERVYTFVLFKNVGYFITVVKSHIIVYKKNEWMINDFYYKR